MKFKRKFLKYFNRSEPLFSVQYWYQGERYGLPRITDNFIYYNPLFIYQKDKSTDVYYDVDNDEPLIQYFRKRPGKFNKLANQHEKICQELLRLSKRASQRNFSKIFNLHMSFWAGNSIMMILGEWIGEPSLKKIAQQAYQMRQKTDKVEYLSGNNLIKLAEQLLPNYKDFIDFLTFEEIINKNIPDIEELKKRKMGYIYFEGKLYTNLTTKQLEKSENIKIINTDSSCTCNKNNNKFLKGTVAMPGKLKGKVKIVFEVNQLDKIREGDILVTPMTTPDYIIAMRKALAFITDEGGLTCHAAIIAREMKKPCIIGTKIATQVLKDGDLVEVDAKKGIVNIIKKKG